MDNKKETNINSNTFISVYKSLYEETIAHRRVLENKASLFFAAIGFVVTLFTIHFPFSLVISTFNGDDCLKKCWLTSLLSAAGLGVALSCLASVLLFKVILSSGRAQFNLSKIHDERYWEKAASDGDVYILNEYKKCIEANSSFNNKLSYFSRNGQIIAAVAIIILVISYVAINFICY